MTYVKRADDYTADELLTLDDDTVARLIDLECAFQGVELLPASAPGDPPTPPDYIQPDTVYYSTPSMEWLDAEAAARVLAAIEAERPYMTGTSYRGELIGSSYVLREVHSYEKPSLTPEPAYTSGRVEGVADELDAYKRKKGEWDREKSTYDSAVSARREVSDQIWEKISEARDINRERTKMLDSYQRYLKLAGGDEGLAATFLLEARPNAREVMGEELPEAKVPEGMRPPEFQVEVPA